MKKIGGFFVKQVRKELSLKRSVKNPQRQTRHDRLSLTFSFWAHFYFNYVFSPGFDSYIEEACHCTQTEEFRQRLLELFELHYLSALMSFNTNSFRISNIQQRHFTEMQDGYYALAEATGASPSEIIDNTLHDMLYHDISYTWSTRPIFGSMNYYYSTKALLYQIKRQLDKQ